MPGLAVSQPWMLSRRSRYSASIDLTASCLSESAANAAFCVIDMIFEVDCPCTVLISVVSSFGATVQPQRQPVIAYALDADPASIVRARLRSNSTFGRLC